MEFLGEAWSSEGDKGTIENASNKIADGISDFYLLILEVLILFGVERGIRALFKALGKTRFGKWIGVKKTKIQKSLKKEIKDRKQVNKAKSYEFKEGLPKKVLDKIPSEWKGEPNNKGVGFRWYDPINQKSNGIRIDKGNLNRDFETQFVDHVVVRSGGEVLGRNGKPIQGSIADNGETAHIPLSEYIKWKSWNQK